MAAPNEITHWRSQIFARLLLVTMILGVATAVPSSLLAGSEGVWSVVVVDWVALLWIFAIWRSDKLAYASRVANFLAMVFMVGVVLLVKVRPLAQIYLMAVPLFAALLLGLRPALWALGATALAVLLVGYHMNGSPYGEGVPHYVRLTSPLMVTLNFLFIGAVLTLPCAMLLQRLARSLVQERANSESLEQGQRRLQLLNAELRLTSAAVARLNDMVLIAEVDAAEQQRIIFVNEAFERRTGYCRDEVLGRDLRLLQGPDTDAQTLARIAAATARSEPVRAELLNYTKAGETYWVETELVPFADEGGNNTHWVAVERDISDRKRSEDDIHRLAFYDMLTGLPNRRLLMDRIDKLLASSERDGSISAVLFIDLDHFKYINDARGHATGDALLRNAADRLSQLMRKADTVARIGGDEFVVLLSGVAENSCAASHAALTVAEKVRAAIGQSFDIDGQSYQSSASIGVTLLPKGGQTAQDLLREADTAMYRAKAEGRNGIAFYEAAMQARVEQRLSMERDLGAALSRGELQMHLQPQVDRDGCIIGAELLMRWGRADGSTVSPAVFIPVAEESGLIQPLGLWALQQACAAVVRLTAAGQPLPLSVNVSPSQFRQEDFVEQVRRALDSTGAPAAMLILEVTEGLLIDKLDDTIARMHQLAALGLRFSIDDFGTGYSSLAYLKKLPLYELKIDRSFIRDTPEDGNDKAIVQAILAMARHLGLRVVAEGVETQAQADFLNANGCDCRQGFLYGRAMPLTALLAELGAGAGAACAA